MGTADEVVRTTLVEAIRGEFASEMGFPMPFGAALRRHGINFAVFSQHATVVTLVLFLPGLSEPIAEFPLDPHLNRTGNVWHVFVRGLDPGVQYGYRMDANPNPAPKLHHFDPTLVLLDPFAKAVAGRPVWGREGTGIAGVVSSPPHGDIVENAFSWEGDKPLNIPLADSVIYEVHVRGFTVHPSSGVKRPGTFAGLAEKIPYLKDLGVTAVELMPVNEFDEADCDNVNPSTGERLLNYWGYQPISFFAPKSAYAGSPGQGAAVREFKEMVKRLHAAGIEVILDVVFNHTAEGNERGRTISFKGIDNEIYYILDPETGAYRNYSGVGNTLNCNHPIVRDMILDCLRYWVAEMHVDGFRFDLASILGRGKDGEVLANPPLLEHIAADPLLAATKVIAEAWDAAGLYQVGLFSAWGRWAEWNGKFRDDIRRFVKSDGGMVPALATRLAGSPDLYPTGGGEPCRSINFVTCHDGFTLADLVSYNEKHNQMNGENNADGSDTNFSWNCGIEGPTDSPEIQRLRARQVRNLAALLLLSNGVPMICAGDEMGRTQQGNNNAYCQDNEISWIDWGLLERNDDLFRFVRLLIAFRRRHTGMRMEWHGVRLGLPDWSDESRSLAVHLWRPAGTTTGAPAADGAAPDPQAATHLFLIANAFWEPLTFELPRIEDQAWFRFVDTTLNAPQEITDPGEEMPLGRQDTYRSGPRSVVILVGKLKVEAIRDGWRHNAARSTADLGNAAAAERADLLEGTVEVDAQHFGDTKCSLGMGVQEVQKLVALQETQSRGRQGSGGGRVGLPRYRSRQA